MLWLKNERPLDLCSSKAVVFVFLLLTNPTRGQFQTVGPKPTIVAVVGEDVILPVQLTPAENVDDLTVEWARPDLEPRFVLIRRDGQELIPPKNKVFTGRTSLFEEELKNGNVSLKLSNVRLSDEGTYRCFIPYLAKESFVDLFIGVVSVPTVVLVGLDKTSGGVIIGCESEGCYPEPEVSWLDSDDNIIPADAMETVRDPGGLYTIRSNVTVAQTATNRFSCRVQQQHIKQTRETLIYIPGVFFGTEEPCPGLRPALGFLALTAVGSVLTTSLLLCICFICLIRRSKYHSPYSSDKGPCTSMLLRLGGTLR